MRAATARALWQCHPTCTALLSLQQSVRSASLWGSTAQTQSPDTKPRSPDYIHLKGLVFHGYHGVLPEVYSSGVVYTKQVTPKPSCYTLLQENLLGQKFVVDATLFVDLLKAGQSDNVHDTVSYADVYRYACISTCAMPTSPDGVD